MYEYIITWVLTITFMVSCPDANKTNEFGMVNSSMTTCAVMHTDSKQEVKMKKFTNRETAFTFYKKAKKYEKSQLRMWTMQDRMSYIKIDSILKK